MSLHAVLFWDLDSKYSMKVQKKPDEHVKIQKKPDEHVKIQKKHDERVKYSKFLPVMCEDIPV